MSCKTCFEDYICKCVPYDEVIVIRTNVDEGIYTFIITDSSGRKFTGPATRTGSGSLEIAIADLPEGLLTEFSGDFSIQIFNEEACNTPVALPLVKEYDCISLSIVGGTIEKNTIGCANPFPL
jgi:hypothetical protein